MAAARPRMLLGGIIALFCARVALALVVVPPWQNPDEPQNVAFVHLLHEDAGTHDIDDLILRHRGGLHDDAAGESAIVSSMARFGWWTHYGRSTPEPLPLYLRAISDDLGLPGGSSVYFTGSAWLFDRLRIDSVVGQLLVLRLISAVFGVLAVCFVWAGTRLLFGDAAAAGTATLMALHPQFLLVSIAANPDAIVNCCGAFAWWQTGRLIRKGHAAASLALMFAAAAAAIAIKRLGFPLLLGDACASALWLWKRWSRTSVLIALRAAGLALLAIGVATATFPTEVARILATASFVDQRWKLDLSWEWISGFSRSLYDSTWLVAGWMRYPVHGLWVVAWSLVLAVAVLGLIAAWKTLQIGERIGILAAATFVLVHLLAIYLVHFPLHSGAQGRYLFPALGPMLALIWVGWRACAVRSDAVRWPMVLVLFAFGFDVAAWATVLLPVYAR